jgi:uncharacterized protein (TIGR02996 family)
MSRRELLSLLRTAREHPDDVAPRLVIADWLEEHGDEGDRARAKIIRLRNPGPRYWVDNGTDPVQALYRTYEDTWLGRLRTVTKRYSVYNGFIQLDLNGRQLLSAKMAALADSEEWAWVTGLQLKVEPGSAAAVADSPLLGHAGRLRVEGKPEALRKVFASPHLRGVATSSPWT